MTDEERALEWLGRGWFTEEDWSVKQLAGAIRTIRAEERERIDGLVREVCEEMNVDICAQAELHDRIREMG